MSGTIIVPRDVARRAEGLIGATIPANVLKGVELLLFENLFIEGASNMPNANQADCSTLLKRGTNLLQNSPFDLLGVEVSCRTAEVRKAYKKLALKYHPDKNPKTTPLFQIIQAACSKLSDSEQRTKEAAYVTQRRAAAGVAAVSSARPADHRPCYPPFAGNNNVNNYSNYGTQKAAPAAAAASSAAAYNSYQQPAQKSAYQPYQQPQPQPQQQQPPSAQQQPQQQSARSKSYYEELLKEQYRKAAAAEHRAKEYANRRFAEQKGENDWSSGQPKSNNNSSNNNSNNKPQPSATPDMKPDTNPFNRGSTNSNPSTNNNNSNNNNTEPKLNPFRPAAQQAAPNPVQVNQSYDWQNIYNNNTNPNGKSNATSNQQQQQSKPPPQQQSQVQQADSSSSCSGAARTYRATFDGQVHVQQTIPPINNKQAEPKVTPRKIVPKPFDLKFASIAATMVELEWKTSALYSTHLAVELSWREKYPPTNRWESADKLIRSGCCRKKNLKARTCYEFRVRAVEDTGSSGIQGGSTSEWTETLTVTLPAPPAVVEEDDMAAAVKPPVVQQPSTSAARHAGGGGGAKPGAHDTGNAYRKFNVLGGDDDYQSTSTTTKNNVKGKSLSPVQVEASPAMKGLAKYLSKDKLMSSSAREAWGDNSKPNSKPSTTSKSRKPSVQTDDNVDNENVSFFEIEEDLDDLFSTIKKGGNNPATTTAAAQQKSTSEVSATDSKVKSEEKYSDDEFEVSDDEEVIKIQRNKTVDEIDAEIIEEEEEVYTDDSDYSSTISRKNKNKKKGGSTSLDTSLDHEEEMLEYTLIAPPFGWNSKSSTKRASAKETRDSGGNYRHPVHSEPFPKSSIKGYLRCERTVIVGATCGDWLRVKIHMPIISDSVKSSSVKSTNKVVWGWCLQLEQGHEFLQPAIITSTSKGKNYNCKSKLQDGLSINPHDAATSSAAGKSNGGGNSHMTPPKESLGKAYFGSSAILNKSFFNMPRPTPSKEKMSSASKASFSSGIPAADDNKKVNTKKKKKSSIIEEGDESSEIIKEAIKKAASSVITEEETVEDWMECFDDQGHCYYYNESKNESQWELPEWVEEIDPQSGAKYYIHAAGCGDNVVFTSTWDKPKKYARLIRSTTNAAAV